MKGYQRKLGAILLLVTLVVTLVNMPMVYAKKGENEGSHIGQVKFEHKAIRPHFDFYYQLLTEKYAPRHVKVWQEVINEREALLKQYRELDKSGKDIGNFYNEEWLSTHKELQNKFLIAVEKRDDAALKNIVPLVIDHQKELNALLKKRLKELK